MEIGVNVSRKPELDSFSCNEARIQIRGHGENRQNISEFKLMRKRLYFVFQLSVLSLLLPGVVRAQWNPLNLVLSVQRESDGVQLTLQNGALRLQVCSDSIIRVRYSPTAAFPSRPDTVVMASAPRTLRRADTCTCNAASSTTIFGHTRSSNSSLVTRCPARSTSAASKSKAGVRTMAYGTPTCEFYRSAAT